MTDSTAIISLLKAEFARDRVIDSAMLEKFAAHWALMLRWNTRVNLTALTDPHDGVVLHYRDSLQGLPHLKAGPIVDMGSGAGFPGIPLAIVRPDWRFTLVEPRHKRASFLRAACSALQLDNVTVLCGRLEDAADGAYAHAVTRAVFRHGSALKGIRRWLVPGGTLLAYRGADAPAVEPGQDVVAYPYVLQERRRRIDVWNFP